MSKETLLPTETEPLGVVQQPACSLLPCVCCGKVGSRAAVKLHPRLNLIDGVTRYDVRCARCKKKATTKNGKGFPSWRSAIKAWNHKANVPALAQSGGEKTKPKESNS